MCQVYCPIFLKKGKPVFQDYKVHLDHHRLTLKSTLFRTPNYYFCCERPVWISIFCHYKEIISLGLGTVFFRAAADTSFCVYISIGAVKYITFLFEKIIPKTVKHSYIGNYFVSFQPSSFNFLFPYLVFSTVCFVFVFTHVRHFFRLRPYSNWGFVWPRLCSWLRKLYWNVNDNTWPH